MVQVAMGSESVGKRPLMEEIMQTLSAGSVSGLVEVLHLVKLEMETE